MHNCAGIMVTTKKRQDFRIQLQKRARRRAEKKIEYLEDDKNWKDVSNASRASYSLLALIIPSSSIICLLRHAPLSCPMQRAAWKAFTEHFLMLFFFGIRQTLRLHSVFFSLSIRTQTQLNADHQQCSECGQAALPQRV